jgi:glycogen debranching enzyme
MKIAETTEDQSNDKDIFEIGYSKAIELFYRCASKDGFFASPTEKTNYRRIWGRDGSILTIAALLTDETDLIESGRRTLKTLADYQGPHGEIPSNVDTTSDRISYGGMAGRVDANLWFIIACGEYWRATGDDDFLDEMIPSIEKVRFLLGAWEFNNRGLLYIPETGDWADEYIHNGYVLFDQLLYLQALRTLCAIRRARQNSADHALREKADRLKHLIRANYWFVDDVIPDDVYHEILYKKGRKAATRCATHYWAPFFSPHGYGYRFDSLANILVSLLDVADDERRNNVEKYIRDTIMTDGEQLLPAFAPVIKPMDDDWDDLHMTFSYTFKNAPYEYHNGGLWPMISGFYVADLACRGKREIAERHLKKIHEANSLVMNEEPWSFPEYIHGSKHTAGGTRHQGWSAAGAVIGTAALQGKSFFRISDKNA